MLFVPRTVRLATWASAVLTGRAELADLVRAVRGPGDVDPGSGGEHHPLPELVGLLADSGVTALRVVLPVPGDVSGLPGPPEFNSLACDVGECAVTVSGSLPSAAAPPPAFGVVPQAAGFGSQLEPGTLVTWTVHPVHWRPHLAVTDLGEADRRLRRALAAATSVLGDLDVARWRPEVAELWDDLSGAVLDPTALPPTWPGRAVQVLTTGLRLRAIIDLALDDDGGAVSGWEAQQRRASLRELDGVARHAVAAAAGPHE